MPKIQGTKRTVQTNTTRLTPPSTAGFGASGRALQQLGNTVSSAGNQIADAFGAVQEKNDHLDTSIKLLEHSMDQDNKQFFAGRSIDKDGRDHVDNSLNRYDTESEAFIQTLPKGQQQRARLHITQKRASIQNESQRQQGAHQDVYWTNRGVEHGNNITKTMINPDTIKKDGLNAGRGAIAVYDKAVDQMPISAGRRQAMKTAYRKVAAKEFVKHVDPLKYKKGLEVFDKDIKGQNGNTNEKTKINNAPDYRGQKGPAAIRYNNPGAQWPGPSAKKYGMTHAVTLKDGQNNKIAVFPTMVHGAAAQFDLLNRRYTGMTLAAAIKKWSGGNHWQNYVAGVVKKTGLKPNTVLTKEMMQNPQTAIPLTIAMSQHEVGRKGVMSEQHWLQAHQFFMSGGKGDVASYAQRRSGDTFTEELFSEENRKFIDKKLERMQEQEFIGGVISGEIKVSGNDTEAMKRLNKAVNTKFGPDTDFATDEEARSFILKLSENQAPLPRRYMQRMEGDLDSKDPARIKKALVLLDEVERLNSSQFKAGSSSEKLGKQLTQYRLQSEFKGSDGAIEHILLARENMIKMSAEDMKSAKNKAIKELSAEEFLTEQMDDPDDWFFQADPVLGLTPKAKSIIVDEFQRLFASEFDVTGDSELAKASALHLIKSRYGYSSISGTKTVMKYPPESFVDKEDIPHVQSQFDEGAADIVKRYSPIFKAQGIKLIGAPILVSDDLTRQSVENWKQGKVTEEFVEIGEPQELLMDGISKGHSLKAVKTPATPIWRYAVKIDVNGTVGYRVLPNEYFKIEGLGQVRHDRVAKTKQRIERTRSLKQEVLPQFQNVYGKDFNFRD